jgi:hypothetical protein
VVKKFVMKYKHEAFPYLQIIWDDKKGRAIFRLWDVHNEQSMDTEFECGGFQGMTTISFKAFQQMVKKWPETGKPLVLRIQEDTSHTHFFNEDYAFHQVIACKGKQFSEEEEPLIEE